MSREIIITVDANRRIVNYAAFVEFCNEFKTGRTLLTAKDYRKRSASQNAYYWGVVVPMVKVGLIGIGYDEIKDNDDAHEFIKAVHLSKKIRNPKNDDEVLVQGTTQKLTIAEFNDFLEAVIKWAALYLGTVIPAPSSEYAMLSEYNENLERLADEID